MVGFLYRAKLGGVKKKVCSKQNTFLLITTLRKAREVRMFCFALFYVKTNPRKIDVLCALLLGCNAQFPCTTLLPPPGFVLFWSYESSSYVTGSQPKRKMKTIGYKLTFTRLADCLTDTNGEVRALEVCFSSLV